MIEALRKRSGDEKSLSNVFAEYLLGDKERAGECLLIRERMIKTLSLPSSFAVDYYFAEVSACSFFCLYLEMWR